jgi:hypothetical protein
MPKNTVEQLSRRFVNHSRSHVRHLKRLASKLMRRLGKRELDDAPKRLPTRGYSD